MECEYIGFGYDGKKVQPPICPEIAGLVLDIVRAEKDLDRARSLVPEYTGQWSDEDYYADEQERFNRASDRLYGYFERRFKRVD